MSYELIFDRKRLAKGKWLASEDYLLITTFATQWRCKIYKQSLQTFFNFQAKKNDN